MPMAHHAFYAYMGGFALDSSGADSPILPPLERAHAVDFERSRCGSQVKAGFYCKVFQQMLYMTRAKLVLRLRAGFVLLPSMP